MKPFAQPPTNTVERKFPGEGTIRVLVLGLVCLLSGISSNGCHVIAVKEHREMKAPGESTGEQLYRTHCTKCHSLTPSSAFPKLAGVVALPLDDPERMKHYPREYLVKVITRGGKSVGRSQVMPRWDEVFSPEEISRIVDFLTGIPSTELRPPVEIAN